MLFCVVVGTLVVMVVGVVDISLLMVRAGLIVPGQIYFRDINCNFVIVVQLLSAHLNSIEIRSRIGLADCELNYAFKICKFDIRYVKNEEVPLFLSQKLCNRHNKLKRTLSFDRTSVPSFFFK